LHGWSHFIEQSIDTTGSGVQSIVVPPNVESETPVVPTQYSVELSGNTPPMKQVGMSVLSNVNVPASRSAKSSYILYLLKLMNCGLVSSKQAGNPLGYPQKSGSVVSGKSGMLENEDEPVQHPPLTVLVSVVW
jgi:hypothetical protein